jgi:formylglycine-generating enzyme required for sulfatase activity
MRTQTLRSQTGRTGAVRLIVLVIFALGLHLAGLSAEQRASAVPGPATTFTLDLAAGVKMEFVLIRPGSFQMGSAKSSNTEEKPIHKVTISKPFYMGKYEVTQEQWQAVMGSNPSNFKGPKNPVEMVSWNDCQEFLKKINAKFPGMGFRLPSEAEWEYACRAGSTTEYCYGNGERGLGDYAWYDSNSSRTTHPVGEKKPNAWGLYDMHGNVWEWCQDGYRDSYNGAPTDGSAWESLGSRLRVLRGGDWRSNPRRCRSATRNVNTPGVRAVDIGFRLSRTP